MKFIGWHIHEANVAGLAQSQPKAPKKAPPPDNRPTKQQILELYERAIEAGDAVMENVWFTAYEDAEREEEEARIAAQYDEHGNRK